MLSSLWVRRTPLLDRQALPSRRPCACRTPDTDAYCSCTKHLHEECQNSLRCQDKRALSKDWNRRAWFFPRLGKCRAHLFQGLEKLAVHVSNPWKSFACGRVCERKIRRIGPIRRILFAAVAAFSARRRWRAARSLRFAWLGGVWYKHRAASLARETFRPGVNRGRD